MARRHYHVLAGMGGGYMPNSNDVYSTKGAACDGAQWHAEEWKDSSVDSDTEDERTRVYGNKREGYTIVREERTAGGSWRQCPYDLGHYIKIVDCLEDDCETEED